MGDIDELDLHADLLGEVVVLAERIELRGSCLGVGDLDRCKPEGGGDEADDMGGFHVCVGGWQPGCPETSGKPECNPAGTRSAGLPFMGNWMFMTV